jgi:multiple sugar transport system substrate-binding protein
MRASKWFTIVSLVMIVVLALSACAPKAEPTPVPAPTAAPKAEAKPAEATQAPAPTQAPVEVANPPTSADQVDAISLEGKSIEVIYWHNRPQTDQDFLQSMLDEFNANNPYGIVAKAEIAGASYNDVYNKINAAIPAGAPPSMAVAYQNQAALYRGQGAVIDLTPFVKSKKYGLSEADLNDYFQAFLASDANPQFKGEILGFPTQRSMDVMYYNVDWLNKLGYTEPPKDWKTFEEIVCKAAQEEGKYGWAFRHDASNFASQVFARGGRILAEDGSAYVFNSEAGQETLSMIQRLFASKCAIEIPVSERYGEQNRFGNGEVLFVFASSSGLPYYQQSVAQGANFKWDIAMLPNNGKPAVNLYGASISVFKTTPEQELAAWLVIKFLGDTEQTARWAAQTGYLPVRQSAEDEVVNAFKSSELWGPVADTYAKLFDWAQYAMIESPVAGYDPVRKIIDEELMSVVITDPNADVKALLDQAVVKSNQILAENAPK